MGGNLNFCHSTGVWTKDDGSILVPAGQSWAGNDSNPEVNLAGIHGKLVHSAQDIHKIGPLPVGVYRVGEWGDWQSVPAYAGVKHLGKLIASLTQTSGESFGRDGFFIHGPAKEPLFGQESMGCTVTMHDYRVKVSLFNPLTVTVTA